MARKSSRFQVGLTSRPLDLHQALRLVGCPETDGGRARAKRSGKSGSGGDASLATGAVVGFTGIVRELEDGRPLRGIQYEEYRSMALKEMNRILDEARKRWLLQAAVVLHRTGETPVGHPSVAVAVAAGHRSQAFEAARFLIDAVKDRVPLWKNFLFADERKMKRRLPKFLLAVPIQTPPKSPADFARQVRRAGANAVELRADALAGKCKLSPEEIRQLVVDLRRGVPGLAAILTPRARAEGGVANLSIVRRKEIIETCLPDVDAVDVELDSGLLVSWASERVEGAGKLLILSNHDFEKTPSVAVLDGLLREASEWPRALLKIAATSPRRTDLLRLLDWTRRHVAERPLATMTMGDRAQAGRIALAALGSRLAFAALGEASAAGQIDVRVFARALRGLRGEMNSMRAPVTREQFTAILQRAEEVLNAVSVKGGARSR